MRNTDPVHTPWKRPAVSRRFRRRDGGPIWILFALGLILSGQAGAGEQTLQREDAIVAAQIDRVLPGVVGILTEVGAEVTIRCGRHDTHVVNPEAVRENATGFIIHPDGWIATNGHVIKPVFKDDAEHVAAFLKAAAREACGTVLKRLPVNRRKQRLAAILEDPENRRRVKLFKKLEVYLPTGLPHGLPAVVKAYSPPIDPDRLPKDGTLPNPPMLDAAIIKVDATNLPAVRLAPNSAQVLLGQKVVIAGYPGVVVWHNFLSKKSQAEPSVTFGRVSAFRLDVNERRILQTDAAISWGNSGGPAFDMAGEVFGVATFISTSLEGDQAVQGFNFLIPIDTIQALAKGIGLTPAAESPFMEVWNKAIDSIIEGRYREALGYVDDAIKIIPGLIDTERVQARLRERLQARHETTSYNYTGAVAR
ncbi:MAG TPA: serine protease [Candidatus Baltobacteraceae bacterium]|nr:serine protease [Candidatus Baltobacteraceae bacterium]